MDETVMEFGQFTPFTCPECHGVFTALREGPLVRVQLADVTYAPNQGDRVKFLLYRTSAGDKLAKAVSLIS